jgi:hypothetical protein
MRTDPLNNEPGSISGTLGPKPAEAIDAIPSKTSETAAKLFIWRTLLIKFHQTSRELQLIPL